MIIKPMLLSLFILFVIVFSASHPLSSQLSVDQTRNVEPVRQIRSEREPTQHDPVLEGWMQTTAKAWQSFIQGGRYRWAGPGDFRFPDWAKQRYFPDLERAVRIPIQEGHIKHDYGSKEAALIVVDTTNQDWNRYGIVVFSRGSRGADKSEVKWLYKDRDLSRAQLAWSSGDTLGVIEYHEDGSYSSGFVQWNKKTQQYSCDLRRIK